MNILKQINLNGMHACLIETPIQIAVNTRNNIKAHTIRHSEYDKKTYCGRSCIGKSWEIQKYTYSIWNHSNYCKICFKLNDT